MASVLPERALPRVAARAHAPRRADLAKLDALLIVVPEGMREDAWKRLPRSLTRFGAPDADDIRLTQATGEGTGFGVRFAVNLLLEQKILEQRRAPA